jgi:hypothetical protein
MSPQPYAVAATFPGTQVPKVCNQPDRSPAFAEAAAMSRRSAPEARVGEWFGDLVIITFLLAQCLDGIFTYLGVLTHGISIEANPLIASLMAVFGFGPALAAAKVVAGALGICLHLRQIHSAVAFLSLFYLAVAIVPWSVILFF